MQRLAGNVWLFWGLLTLPFLWLVFDRLVLRAPGGQFFYWTGVIGVWLLLASLAVTPLRRLSGGAGWSRWLMKRRRHIGVAAFGYSLVHTLDWMRQASPGEFLHSFIEPLVLFGWIGLAVFLAMAATSNDWSVRRMGPDWKRLQRWVYLAAPLTLLHWFMAEHYRIKTVAVYSGILGLIVLLRALARPPLRNA
ncbi:sulfite oxidase heme-binding subunit YedZ (plasmid) [Roseobacteraceae bacterium NS-SX3]